MPNLCRDLKTEYEALKTLNTEFVLACEKAGDPAVLSQQALKELQYRKNALEQQRDNLERRLGNTFWRRAVDAVLSSVSRDAGPNQGKSVEEILSRPERQQLIYDEIDYSAKIAWTTKEDARRVVLGFHAACSYGILDEAQIEKLRKKIDEHYCLEKIREDMESRQQKEGTMIGIRNFIAMLDAIEGLELFEKDQRALFLERAQSKKFSSFQEEVAAVIMDDARQGIDPNINQEDAHHKILHAVVCFFSARRLGVLTDEQCRAIRKELETSATIHAIKGGVLMAVKNIGAGEYSTNIMRVANAVNGLHETLYPNIYERQKNQKR